MSVIVMGMEMPKHGDVLVVREHNGKTYIKHEGHLGFEATLTEIPTPHGRLGDLDKLEKQFKRAIGTYLPKDPTRHMSIVDGSECRGWTQALTAVQEAETVIEAEGEA